VNIANFLARSAARFGPRPAVSWRGSTITFSELDLRSSGLAHAITTFYGFKPGSRMAVFMDNRPELLEGMFASFRAGGVAVPCNSRSTVAELQFILTDCDAAVVLTDEAHAATAVEAARGRPVVVAGDHYETLIHSGPLPESVPVVDRTPEDIAWLFYTSGITGRPKGAMLSHGALNFVIVAWHSDLMPLDEADVTLHVAPLSHGAGFHALAATAVGAHQVVADQVRFDPEAVLMQIREHGVTNTWMVPTQIIRISQVGPDSDSLPTLRHVLYGSAPMSPTATRQAINVFGRIFIQLYGMGETPMTISSLRANDHIEELIGSAGFPRLGLEVRVVDDEDGALPDGQVGEVVVRGPSVMSGYWGQPDASASALRNGWLHTGDLGRFSSKGVLTLLDRTKDVIISGGSNVYAVEVERVLEAHPKVREAAVVGIPDELWGERVAAAIVASDPGDRLWSELETLCRGQLSDYKVPRRYRFVDELPRNTYGKVLKGELRRVLTEAESIGKS
jgi:acyl-CoA synthetase (AMP-forming)/AMP-acid ligase II